MGLDNEKQPVDRWLDAAIKEYGSVELDTGLDQRVLRNLQTRAERRTASIKWWALAATAAVVLLMAGVLINRSQFESKKTVEVRGTAAIANAHKLASAPPTTVSSKSEPRPAIKARKHWPAQFPTPQPLSAEERMFASYAEHFPKDAMLTEQEHDKFEEEVRQAQLAFENGESHSNQER